MKLGYADISLLRWCYCVETMRMLKLKTGSNSGLTHWPVTRPGQNCWPGDLVPSLAHTLLHRFKGHFHGLIRK